MATRLESQPYDTATANFKLWTGFIRHVFLTDAGWTATSDTGQTNPTTVGAAPTNGNSIYEVYQATDALSGTAPLMAKVEYGQFNSAPSISITIGTGSNGSGVITGGGNKFRTSGQGANPSGTLGGTGYECVGSADASGIRFLMWRNYAGANPLRIPCFFAIERSRDSSGAYTGDYATIFVYGHDLDYPNANGTQSVMFRQQSILAGGGAGSVEQAWLTFQSTNGTASLGTNVAVVPLFNFATGLGNPSEDLLCGKAADFPEAGSVSVQVYGSAHTYYCSKVGYLPALGNLTYAALNNNLNEIPNAENPYNNQTQAQCLLFRYE